MIIRSFLFLIGFLSQLFLVAQSVWPGDVNNNGIVNNVDLIYLGFAYGESGSPRSIINGNWESKTLPTDWEGTFPNGLNFSYADANGDGIIDDLDIAILSKNSGLSHDDVPFIPDNILEGEIGKDSRCSFIAPPDFAPIDQIFNLKIGLGDVNLPIDNLYGFSFKLNVEPDLIGIDSTKLTFKNNTWIEQGVESSIELIQKNDLKAEYKVTFSKKDRMPVSGYGELGSMSFVVEGDIVGFLVQDRDTVTFTLDSVRVLNGELNPIPVVGDTLKLEIRTDLILTDYEHPNLRNLELYPNPNRGLILIKSTNAKLEKVELYNNLGQIIFEKKLNDSSYQSLNLQSINHGFYWLKIYSEYGIKTESIQKL